jgi:antitoxin FitA
MPSLTIKNIPENLYQHLKQAASLHRRSINSETIICLEKMLLSSKVEPSDQRILAAQALRKKVKSKLIDIAEIDEAKHEGRP